MSSRARYILGIDEVGRGALAGPLTIGAVLIPRGLRFPLAKLNLPLRDSKKLTPNARERWVKYLKTNTSVRYVTARVMPKTIDRLNISHAANVAAARACSRILLKNDVGHADVAVYIDGGLFLDAKTAPELETLGAKTIVKGDEKITAIKLASIMAKVSRDRYMTRLHRDYPSYHFDVHKGYGTKKHIHAVRTKGASDVHRLTFIRNYVKV